MHKLFVIAWRPHAQAPYFFRGDGRYKIFLPYISEDVVTKGWVRDIRYARIFEAFPVLDRTSFAKNFDVERLRIFPFEGDVVPTQLHRPVKRPHSKNVNL